MRVFRLDLDLDALRARAVLGVPAGITIHGAQRAADGFTVLPNGNFLINDADGADCACPYREYNGTTGQLIPPPQGLEIDLSVHGFMNATGVAISPDGQSLYFICDFKTIVRTDLAGNLMCSRDISPDPQGHIEDIDVLVFPEQ